MPTQAPKLGRQPFVPEGKYLHVMVGRPARTRLAELARATDLSVAHFVRLAVDEYLDRYLDRAGPGRERKRNRA